MKLLFENNLYFIFAKDTKSVLDQCLRIMQAILDICAYQGWLTASLSMINLMQMSCQGRWLHDSDLISMPHLETEHLSRFYNNKVRIDCLPRLIDYLESNNYEKVLESIIGDLLDRNQIREIYQVVSSLPQIEITMNLSGNLPNQSTRIQIDTMNEKKTYQLYEEEEYAINIDIVRLNKSKRQQKAYAPKYPKPKDENWILVLGLNNENESTNELIALKRINNFKMNQNSNISFRTPKCEDTKSDKTLFKLTLYFMSDVYIGLDQQFELHFDIKKIPQGFY